MLERRGVLLTGATGLLGQYLLRDLLLQAHPVAVLVRDSRKERAAERIAQMLAHWSERFRRKLPTPTILNSDLGRDALGLTAVDRWWLRRHCRTVIHSAASLSFRRTPDGEPWRTNVEGMQALLALCRDAGVSEWHQVSTAFVCGRRADMITEEDRDASQGFHNAYEESKWQAERLVRGTPRLCATIYRPAVIVGDSRTGHTSSFNGLYRFLELAVRLASMQSPGGATRLPLRLALSGDEAWNLVPVDWVAQAIVRRWPGPTGTAAPSTWLPGRRGVDPPRARRWGRGVESRRGRVRRCRRCGASQPARGLLRGRPESGDDACSRDRCARHPWFSVGGPA